jgi:hypothetical protein
MKTGRCRADFVAVSGKRLRSGLTGQVPEMRGFTVSNVRCCWWVLASSGGMGVCLSCLSQVNQSET